MKWEFLVSQEIIKATLGLNWAFIKIYIGGHFTGSIISLKLSRINFLFIHLIKVLAVQVLTPR